MDIIVTVLGQIGMMFVLMLIGFFMYRRKMVDDHGVSQMSNLLLWVVNPLVMLTRYQMEFSMEKLIQLGWSLVLGFCVLGLGIVLSKVFARKDQRIDQFALTFPNAGFMGIPLIQGLLGGDSIFYLSAYLTCFGILSYTYGIYLVTGDKKDVSFERVARNPAIIAVLLGLLIFVSPVKLPNFVYRACDSVGSMNTPLAMIVLGTYVAKSKIIELFNDKHTYYVCFIKLLVIPIITCLIFKFIPESLEEVRMVMYITSTTPVGVTIPMFSQKYGGDYVYGARIVGLSTILSLLTIPLMVLLPNLIW